MVLWCPPTNPLKYFGSQVNPWTLRSRTAYAGLLKDGRATKSGRDQLSATPGRVMRHHGWYKVLDCSLTRPLREARKRIRVYGPNSQTAAKGVCRGSVWKLLLQSVYKFITNNPTGPECGVWGNRQGHSLTEIQYMGDRALMLSFLQPRSIESNR